MNKKLLLVGALSLLTFANATNISERVDEFDEWHIVDRHPRSETVSNLSSWENTNFPNISNRLRNNKVTLGHANELHEALKGSKASYYNTGLAYLGYSFIISIQILDEESSLPENYNDKTAEAINSIIDAIKTGEKCAIEFYQFGMKFKKEFPDFDDCLFDLSDALLDLYRAKNYGINVVFFNSDNGACNHRTLNKGASIKAAVAGVPNNRSSFDGILKALPIRYTGHDLGHVFFNDFITIKYDESKLNSVYNAYYTVENAMQKASNNNIKPEDDAIEFELGHESWFKKSSGSDRFPTIPYTSQQFVQACNSFRDNSIKSVTDSLENKKLTGIGGSSNVATT